METSEVKHGDMLYIDSAYYIDHGEDDVCGGLATVKCVNNKTVEFYGLEGIYYGLNGLLEDQNKLKKQFGNKLAHRCPDYG